MKCSHLFFSFFFLNTSYYFVECQPKEEKKCFNHEMEIGILQFASQQLYNYSSTRISIQINASLKKKIMGPNKSILFLKL